MQPIAEQIENAYGVANYEVVTISLVYMGFFIVFNFPSNYVIDKYGIRVGVVAGILFTLVGQYLKCLINLEGGFSILIFGQMIAAVGQPFLANAPTKVAQQWYSEEGRVIATTIGAAANPLGVACGFVLPALFVGDKDTLPENKVHAREDIFYSLLLQAGLTTVVAILVLISFREKPPTPPSASCEVEKTEFRKSLPLLLKNKNALLLANIFGFIMGVFNALGSVAAIMAKSAHYDAAYSPVLGAVFIIGGMIGSALFGIWVEKTKRYKLATILICVLSTIMMGLLIVSFAIRSVGFTAGMCLCIGLVMIPIMPVGFDFVLELTFPVGEAMSTGLLFSMGQLWGIVFTVMTTGLVTDYDFNGTLISGGVMMICCGVAAALSFFMKEDLRRKKMEQQ